MFPSWISTDETNCPFLSYGISESHLIETQSSVISGAGAALNSAGMWEATVVMPDDNDEHLVTEFVFIWARISDTNIVVSSSIKLTIYTNT